MLENIQDLVLFVKVAEMESFSKAGHALGLSPAVVSKRIQKLEAQLGCRLLERTTRRVRTTEIGQDFYLNSSNILSEVNLVENMIREHQNKVAGKIKINTSSILGRRQITPVISNFLKEYPDVNVEMESTEEFVDLIEYEYDLAIRVVELNDRNYIVRKISGHRALVCASPEYLKKNSVPQTPQDLLKHNCLIRSGHREWVFRKNSKTLKVKVSGNFVTNDGDGVRVAACSGVGIAPMASWHIAEEIRQGKLKEVLSEYTLSSEESIYLIYSSKQFIPIRVRRLIDYLVANFDPNHK